MKKLVSLLLAALMISALFAVPVGSADDVVKLTWVQGTDADAPKDAALVGEALNAISREKLGVEAEIVYMTNEQVNTSVMAAEVYDMYFTCDWYNDYATRAYGGVFADITDLVQTVTPDLYATMPEEVWDLAKIQGKLYAVPVKKDYCPEIFLMFDISLFVDKLGMEIPASMNVLDLEPFLQGFKSEYPDRYPLMFAKAGMNDGIFNYLYRQIGIGFPYSAAGTENATKIISVFEDEEMIARWTAMHDWFGKGYVNPDAATLDALGVPDKENYIKIGQGFYGADAIWSENYQYPIAISKISGPYLSTSGVQGSMNAFNAALEANPARLELALKYQELVNTNLQYRDTLRYGIEGTHFNYNEDSTVTKTDLGVSNYNPWAFSQGSYALSSVSSSKFASVPADPHMWDVVFAGYEDALVAADLGFAFDPTPVEMEIAQLIVINEKWRPQLATGTVDPAEALPAVLAEMEAAGLREVIAEAQAQLDAHLATK
ncbi:ABC transporter substrate-binding protein [Clostridia bacterium]|nr:ABC transporter substrate-binding protein [Clostridia bacterium]